MNRIPFIINSDEVTSKNTAKAPAWLGAIKEKSFKFIEDNSFPSTKDEDWKYTSIKSILEKQFVSQIELDEKIQPLGQFGDICNKDEINIVFINGHFSAKHSKIDNLPNGLNITQSQESWPTKSDEFLTQFDKSFANSAFISVNNLCFTNALLISTSKNAVIEKPIHILNYVNTKESLAVSPRCLIHLAQSSQAIVVESFVSFSNEIANLSNSLTEIKLEENSKLTYLRAQSESQKSFHISNTRVWIEANATFNGFAFSTGSCLARHGLDIILNGEGGHAELNGLYASKDKQFVDNHTSVDHRVPNCTSNQLYKGILNDASRAVFNGKVFVRSIAQQTNSYQLNKNLLLGKDCRVDTKPQLEIFADDVKCTHGATIAQLNEDELFYLESRCIGRTQAREMLSHGFVNDILNIIENDSLRNKLDCLILPIFQKL